MSNLSTHLADQDAITAACDAGTCDHPEHHAEQLDDLKCPNCGQTEAFHIAATVWGRYTANGFDQDAEDLPNGDSDWDQYAACICPECHKSGLVEDFQI